jgi:RNA polymerase sigma-70 factor (ECF subfamily)
MEHTAANAMPLTTTGSTTGQEDEDRDLVGKYLDGDMSAFDTLMSRHERQVYGLCLRFVRNPDDAMDLTQEVFIKAFEHLAAFRGDARFRTWVYRIAVNHCINHVKKNGKRFVEIQEDTATVDPSVYRRLVDDERREIVRGLIEALPPKQKAIIELRMNDNLSYEEIASILGRSVSTIKSSVFFALNKLRKMVEDREARGQSGSRA